MTPAAGEPYRGEDLDRIAAVVILQALEDLRSSDLDLAEEARVWLLDEGLAWCRALGLQRAERLIRPAGQP